MISIYCAGAGIPKEGPYRIDSDMMRTVKSRFHIGLSLDMNDGMVVGQRCKTIIIGS